MIENIAIAEPLSVDAFRDWLKTATLAEPLSVDAFRDWLKTAAHGDVIEYFTGDLARSRYDERKPKDPKLVTFLANRVWNFYEAGFVVLVQKRHHEGHSSYIAVRTRAPIDFSLASTKLAWVA